MMVLAIDPGTSKSAVVGYTSGGSLIRSYGIPRNGEVLELLRKPEVHVPYQHLAIEMVGSYGMPVGHEVFATCVWIGRFIEAWGKAYSFLYRREIKLHLCNDKRAKDPNIRAALIERLGKPGTKRAPGPTYGIANDLWSALAVAVTYSDMAEAGELEKPAIPY